MSVSLPFTKISFTIEISFAILDQSRAILSFVFEGEAGMGERVAFRPFPIALVKS